MLLVMMGWVLFFSPDLGSALAYLGKMFGVGVSAFADMQAVYLIAGNWLLWLMAIVGSTPLMGRLGKIVFHENERPHVVAAAVLYMGMFLLSIAYLVTETYNPFLYFRF